MTVAVVYSFDSGSVIPLPGTTATAVVVDLS